MQKKTDHNELAATLPQIVFEADQDGRLTFANEQAFAITGYTRSDLDNGLNLLELVIPADRQRAADNMARVLKGEQVEAVEYTLSRKDGTTLITLVYANQKLENGRPAGLRGIAIDISVRKEASRTLEASEIKFRSLFDLSPQAIALSDVETGRLLDVNRTFCELTGYTKDEVVGRTAPEVGFYSREDRWRFITELKASGEVHDLEMDFRARNGSVLTALMFAKLIRIRDESFIIVVFHDITEKKKLEKELLKTHKLESLGILAGGIAHDFNNLLTAILGNITLAKASLQPGDKIFDLLAETEKSSYRARGLTQQLLTFSKGGAPIITITSARELIRDSARFSLCGANVRCEFSLADDLLPVAIDEGQIGQVIQNIVNNACQAMPAGGTIHIRAENVVVNHQDGLALKQGRYIRISIRDEGHGLPAEHLDKIFDPFFTTREKGNGLGLAICYSIINNHGGMVTVESEPGRGSTFHVFLPVAAGKDPVLEEVSEELIRGRGRILVMDDEDVVSEVTANMLHHLGYGAALARDGLEAIDLYKQAYDAGRPYDAVILDLTVPGGMGGRETIKELLKIDPRIKAIVVSGYATDTMMVDYRQNGFSGVISKPYRISELSRTLHNVLTRADDKDSIG
ncbi:MAG: PAS domain S-box protein [Desulfobacterales bacterium]|nr:PAS domain S-box protein [Desulfobacterales bacterium]